MTSQAIRRSTSARRGSSPSRLTCVSIDHGAERAQDARAAVGGGAPADPEGDGPDARVEHRAKDLARAPRRRGDRIALRRREPRQPRCLRELDHGALAIVGPEPAGADGPADRIASPAAVRHSQPPAAAMATSVPSPPSASGARSSSSSGRADRQPSASAVATSTEVSDPLNESGAKTTRTRAA